MSPYTISPIRNQLKTFPYQDCFISEHHHWSAQKGVQINRNNNRLMEETMLVAVINYFTSNNSYFFKASCFATSAHFHLTYNQSGYLTTAPAEGLGHSEYTPPYRVGSWNGPINVPVGPVRCSGDMHISGKFGQITLKFQWWKHVFY